MDQPLAAVDGIETDSTYTDTQNDSSEQNEDHKNDSRVLSTVQLTIIIGPSRLRKFRFPKRNHLYVRIFAESITVGSQIHDTDNVAEKARDLFMVTEETTDNTIP